MLKQLIATILISVNLGGALVNTNETANFNNEAKQQLRQPTKHKIRFNDEEYIIRFDPKEIRNPDYTFNYKYTRLQELLQRKIINENDYSYLNGTYFGYASTVMILEEIVVEEQDKITAFYYGEEEIRSGVYAYQSTTISEYEYIEYNETIEDTNNNTTEEKEGLEGSNTLNWHLTENNYQQIKIAVLADIESQGLTTVSIDDSNYTLAGTYENQQPTFTTTNKKYNFTNENIYLNVNGTFYAQEREIYIDHESTTGTIGSITQELWIAELTQYRDFTGQSGKIEVELQTIADHPYQTNDYLQVRTTIQTKITNVNLSSLINTQNWVNRDWTTELISKLGGIWPNHTQTITNNDNENETITIHESYITNNVIEPLYVVMLVKKYIEIRIEEVQNLSDPATILEIKTLLPSFSITGYYVNGQTMEIVDIPGMMLTIITLPFSFVSTAFNLTLFAGTPYQINISNLLMTLFAVLVFTFIIKIILGKS